MNVAMTSTHDRQGADSQLTRVAASVAATDGADAPCSGIDLDEALRLSRSLVARARDLDELRRRHGPELMGFRGAFAPLFEDVERAVTDLVRTRLPAGSNPSLDGDR
jgi:hypothetical protein